MTELSPLFYIYYADFKESRVSNQLLSLSLTSTGASWALLHDFALRSEIPYRVISNPNERNVINFYPENLLDEELINNLAIQLNTAVIRSEK